MTGIGVGVVFCILIILVFVLQIFNLVATKSTAPKASALKAGVAGMPSSNELAETSEFDMAAVTTAVYLYQKSKGDQESGILTIKRGPSAWHAVLNERL